MLACHIMTEGEREAVSAWRYPGDYAVYDLPPNALQKERDVLLANPECRENYRSYLDGDVLVGFTNIYQRNGAVMIGVGVAPERCGCGYGTRILPQAVQTARKLYPGSPVCLDVRTWNRRAIRCYEKAGFAIASEPFRQMTGAGEDEFYRMTLEDCAAAEKKERCP